jgi:hypothetical protein
MQICKQVKKTNPLAKNCQHSHILFATMQKIGQLPVVHQSEVGQRAVEQNNANVVALNAPVPVAGGNVIAFNQMGGVDVCHEFTHWKYNESSAEAFVALQLLIDYGRTKSSPILNKTVHSMAVCVAAHRQVSNVIQCLYIQNVIGAPGAVAMQPQPMAQPMMQPMVVGGLLGKLKLHLKEANLQHNDGDFLDRMSPFVTVRINNREERSNIQEGAGRHPVWMMQHFDWEVLDMNHMIDIEVRDKDMVGSEMIGHAQVPMHFFAKVGGAAEWIELKYMGMPAGNIHFTSEYVPQAVVAQPMVQQTVVVQQQAMPMRQGILKMHAHNAHLNFSDVGLLETMSPQVTIRINEQEWRSDVCMGGGRNPEWGAFNRMEHIVMDPAREVHIEVRDKDMIGGDMIGHAIVPLNFFLRPMEGHMNEQIELKLMGFDAGRVHMKSEFISEVQMASGGGGGGGGAGKAMMMGAMVGTMAAVDIAEHDRHRRGPEVVVVNEGHHGHHRR